MNRFGEINGLKEQLNLELGPGLFLQILWSIASEKLVSQ